jgi:dTDP-4-dehydrorhamnose reductase
VARAVVGLVEGGISGLIHVAGPEVTGRVEFARAIAGAFGVGPSKIIPKTTAELGQGAPRPLNGGLLTSRLESLQPDAMRPLAVALADFKARVSAGEGWAVPG